MSPNTMSPNYRDNTSGIAIGRTSGRQKATRHTGVPMRKKASLFQLNARRARATWGVLSKYARQSLKELSGRYSLEVASGELQLLNNGWYVTHAGLLQIARRNGCAGIRTTIEKGLSDPAASRWVFKATVYKSPRSLLGPRCRDACRRNPRRQSRPPEGFRHRPLFGRGTRLGSQIQGAGTAR